MDTAKLIITKLLSKNGRKAIYSITIGVVTLLVLTGVSDPATVAVIGPLALALLNLTPDEVTND